MLVSQGPDQRCAPLRTRRQVAGPLSNRCNARFTVTCRSPVSRAPVTSAYAGRPGVADADAAAPSAAAPPSFDVVTACTVNVYAVPLARPPNRTGPPATVRCWPAPLTT